MCISTSPIKSHSERIQNMAAIYALLTVTMTKRLKREVVFGIHKWTATSKNTRACSRIALILKEDN